MKKNNKMISMLMALILFVSVFGSTTEVFASSDFLPLQARTVVEKITNQYPAYANYINSVMDTIKTSDFSDDSQKIIEFTYNLANEIENVAEKGKARYRQILEANRVEAKTSEYKGIDYATAVAAYLVGVELVKSKGCPNTARYMENALDGRHSNVELNGIEDYNTAWADSLIFGCDELLGKITTEFENKIYPNGASGSISGTFAFTKSNSSLDAYAALHNVEYIVTFMKRADGNGYNVKYALHDVYDFAWGNYEDFQVGFGNNYCHIMQEMGWIKPFDIYITYV